MLFDTHVHYNLSPIYEHWQEAWSKAQAHGVKKSIVVGAGMGSSMKAVEVASQAKGLYAAIGKHPDVYRQAIKKKLQDHEDWQSVFKDIQDDVKAFRKLILENKELVIAIGEVGLDYFRLPEKGAKREWIIMAQKKAFEEQINLALEFNLPVVVHIRDRAGKSDANWEAIKIIKQFRIKNPKLKFVLHCVSGPKEYVQAGLDLGGYVGVDGNISYETAGELRDIIAKVLADRLLLETDAPYLAPEPHKGEVCEPWMVSLVAEYLEKNLKINSDRLYQNAGEFFNVN